MHTYRAGDILPALLVCLVACGPAETTTTGGQGTGAGGQGAGDGGGQMTGQGGSGGQGTTPTGQGGGGLNAGGGGSGGQMAIPLCVQSCSTVADCVSANPISFQDEDNWACNGGVCEYTGCTSTAECQEYYSGFVCAPVEGYPYNGCVQSCSTVADCVSANPVSFQDEDNWACNGGVCEYTGCTSTAECQEHYSGYVCAPLDGFSYNACQSSCSTVADCVSANPISFQDEDNWACANGLCEYTGCTSTAECQEYYSASVCK